MSYLIFMVILAAAAIGRLWLQQRKERSHQETVQGFQTALAKISEPHPVTTGHRRGAPVSRVSAGRTRPGRGPQPLDPARREAAKRRLEARRRARASSAV